MTLVAFIPFSVNIKLILLSVKTLLLVNRQQQNISVEYNFFIMSMICNLNHLFQYHLGRFRLCRKRANVTQIPKNTPSSSVGNSRSISIKSVLSKVFEHLGSVCLGRILERSGVLPTTRFCLS